MKYNMVKVLYTQLILRVICIFILIVSLLLLVIFDGKNNILEEIYLCVILIFNCFLLKAFYCDLKAYRDTNGIIMKEPPTILPIILLSVSIFIVCIYIYQIIFSTSSVGNLILLYITTNTFMFYQDYAMIVVEEKRLYFRNRWIAFDQIRKIDTDCSVRKYVIVLVFTKKMLNLRFSNDMFERFKAALSSIGQLDKFPTES